MAGIQREMEIVHAGVCIDSLDEEANIRRMLVVTGHRCQVSKSKDNGELWRQLGIC